MVSYKEDIKVLQWPYQQQHWKVYPEDNKPDVGSTVIDDDNKFGVICNRSDDTY